MEDERLLLSDPGKAPGAVAEWKALGVDVVRIHARWWAIAPGPDSRRPPARFDAADHEDRAYDWGSLDRAVDLVDRAGMRVMLTVTGPGPLWSSRSPARREPRYKPDPVAFARFARAVATRYGARVDRYLVWNEPNQGGWLLPQSRCRAGVCTPVAPHLYRGLVRRSLPAIKAADPGAQVLIGELAPVGRPPRSSKTALAPLPFLRAMACVDAAYRPIGTGPCAGFKSAYGDAFGYHPHGVLNAPDQRNPDRDEAQIADLGRLVTVLDRLSRSERLRAPGGRFDLYLTEFGYQTTPPDHAVGVSLPNQARYLQKAAYVAWRNPRVRNLTQYQFYDEPVFTRGRGNLSYAGWQSGLRYVNGRAKPALSVFASPFVMDLPPGRRRARLWGQVRPGDAHTVTILRRSPGESTFTPIAQVQTGATGSWSMDMTIVPDAEYRFSWNPDPSGKARDRLSGIVDLELPASRPLRAASATTGS